MTKAFAEYDILDLWLEGRLPIQSILMVSHNIEEAVLMCDRIMILSSHPGRIVQEIIDDLFPVVETLQLLRATPRYSPTTRKAASSRWRTRPDGGTS